MDFLQLLIQGGAVGVALATLWVLFRVVINHAAHTNTLIERNADVNENLCETLGAHTEVIRTLKDVIERKL